MQRTETVLIAPLVRGEAGGDGMNCNGHRPAIYVEVLMSAPDDEDYNTMRPTTVDPALLRSTGGVLIVGGDSRAQSICTAQMYRHSN